MSRLVQRERENEVKRKRERKSDSFNCDRFNVLMIDDILLLSLEWMNLMLPFPAQGELAAAGISEFNCCCGDEKLAFKAESSTSST